MESENNKFTDLNFSEEHLMTESSFNRDGGCFVSKFKGCLLFLLAVVVAVVVGVAVYYAHPDKGKMCEVNPSTDAVGGVVTSPLTTIAPTGKVDIRIPSVLVPLHYNVRFRPNIYLPNPADFKFNGTVQGFFDAVETTREIILHWRQLVIDKNNIKVFEIESMTEIMVDYPNVVMLEPPSEFLKIPTKADLEAGKQYMVFISYEGKIMKDLKGIYYSDYINENGDTVYLLTSQLQATDARKLFPCMDEPALKATFNVTIERKPPMHSKSNMLIYKNETLYDGWVADFYEPTPKMSTYLLAFLVSEFQCVHNYTKTGIRVEVCARPPAYNQTAFAMSIAVDMQEWFEWYHNVSYPLSKTTHVAVPDFSAGAMENWGLIIYRETALLYDPVTSSAYNKQRVAVVVSHELAHMWFGNLVSPEWWDDVWLNEGFASYMELWGIHNIKDFDSWKMEEQFVVEDLQRVMAIDSLVTSHPIYLTVNDPAEIGGLFDSITYSKGASVIRMMKYFLGEETFRWGLSNYLKAKTYGAVGHTDLFNFLTRQSEQDGKTIDVSSIMNTWILQMGYPIVTFNYDSVQGTISLTQEHFLVDKTLNVTVKSPYNYLWEVPISYMTSTSGFPDLNNLALTWLSKPEGSIVNVPTGLDWIIGNVGETFFYRVNYNAEGWQGLINQLQMDHTKFLTTNRAQILNDAFSIGRSGYINQTIALEVTTYMTTEKDYTPWYALNDNMGYIKKMLQKTKGNQYLANYMQKQFIDIYNELGWNQTASDDHLTLRLRTLIISMACSYGLTNCQEEASKVYSELMNAEMNNEDFIVNPNLATTIYCYGVSGGGITEWNFAYQMFRKSNSAAQRDVLLRAMGCASEVWILQRYLEWALAEDVYGIKQQDMRRVSDSVAANPKGIHLAWNFFKSNWKLFYERFGSVAFTLGSIVNGLTHTFSTEWELADLETFLRDNPDQGTAANQFQNAVESTKANIKWREAHEEEIITWLQSKYTSP